LRPGFSPQRLILLVEGNEDDIELTLLGLKQQKQVGNINIVVARDGVEALDFLLRKDENSVPSFVLLGMNLPKVSGLEVLGGCGRTKKQISFPS
jgi:CheY-like chemotaxis protein